MTPFLLFEYGLAVAGAVIALGFAALLVFCVFAYIVAGRKRQE